MRMRDKLTWRIIFIGLMVIFVVSSLITNLGVLTMTSDTRSTTVTLQRMAEDNKVRAQKDAKTLDILEDQTSPETQAEENMRLGEIMKQLDCNTQRIVQRGVDVLVSEGKLVPSGSVMTAECLKFFLQNPGL